MKADNSSPLDSTEIMTVTDVAAYLQCHPSTINRLLRTGDIPGFRVFSDWRLRRSDIDQWIERRTPQAATPASKPIRRGRP